MTKCVRGFFTFIRADTPHFSPPLTWKTKVSKERHRSLKNRNLDSQSWYCSTCPLLWPAESETLSAGWTPVLWTRPGGGGWTGLKRGHWESLRNEGSEIKKKKVHFLKKKKIQLYSRRMLTFFSEFYRFIFVNFRLFLLILQLYCYEMFSLFSYFCNFIFIKC